MRNFSFAIKVTESGLTSQSLPLITDDAEGPFFFQYIQIFPFGAVVTPLCTNFETGFDANNQAQPQKMKLEEF